MPAKKPLAARTPQAARLAPGQAAARAIARKGPHDDAAITHPAYGDRFGFGGDTDGVGRVGPAGFVLAAAGAIDRGRVAELLWRRRPPRRAISRSSSDGAVLLLMGLGLLLVTAATLLAEPATRVCQRRSGVDGLRSRVAGPVLHFARRDGSKRQWSPIGRFPSR